MLTKVRVRENKEKERSPLGIMLAQPTESSYKNRTPFEVIYADVCVTMIELLTSTGV